MPVKTQDPEVGSAELNINPTPVIDQMMDGTEAAPVVKMVTVIFNNAVEGRASTIHIEPLKSETRVRFRIDGNLYTSLILPRSVHEDILDRIKVLANLNIEEKGMPQEGRFRMTIADKEIDLYVAIIALVEGEKAVIKITNITDGAPDLKSLGWPDYAIEIMKRNLNRSNGLILVAGPTDSGKTTTIYSCMQEINKEGIDIATIEDPVEYYIDGISQAQVKNEIGFSAVAGLRSILRQDANIILVGELKETEVIELVIYSSLTSHLLISSLPATDIVRSLQQLINVHVEPFLLASTLKVLVAQQLIRKICPHCQEEEQVAAEILDFVKQEIKQIPEMLLRRQIPDFDLEKVVFKKGKGCARCGNTGYLGRTVALEIVEVNEKIREVITQRGAAIKIEDLNKNYSFVSIKQDALIKAINGDTSLGEALRLIQE